MATSVASQLAKLRKEREALEKREKALMARTHDKALAKIVQLARDAGLTANDIAKALGNGKTAKTKATRSAAKSSGPRGKVAPKYRNPAQPEQTWTGRGKPPVWLSARLAQGRNKEEFLLSSLNENAQPENPQPAI